MKILIFLLLTILPMRSIGCNPLDIVIVADYSGSVNGHEEFVMDALESFIEVLMLGYLGDIRISVIMFADEANVICKLQNSNYHLAEILRYRGINASGGTNIEGALQTATNELLENQGNARQIIVLISDGVATSGGSPEQTLATAQQIRSLGIGICSVLIQTSTQNAALMKEVSDGCYVETAYESLAEELRKMNLCL